MFVNALVITLILVAVCVMLHYETLRGVSRAMAVMAIPPRQRLLGVIGAAFLAHMMEIAVFAVGYMVLGVYEQRPVLTGSMEGDVFDYLYFSAATFTTLGIGDVFPSGPARLTAGIQSLTGLMLIGWTASFTYLAMEKFWDLHGKGKTHKLH